MVNGNGNGNGVKLLWTVCGVLLGALGYAGANFFTTLDRLARVEAKLDVIERKIDSLKR